MTASPGVLTFMVNTAARVRIEIALLVGALIMGG